METLNKEIEQAKILLLALSVIHQQQLELISQLNYNCDKLEGLL